MTTARITTGQRRIVVRVPGPRGPAGAFNWRGAWSNVTAYSVGDAVSLSGSSYLCTVAHTGHTPPNASYWDPIALSGTAGSAPSGTGLVHATGGAFVDPATLLVNADVDPAAAIGWSKVSKSGAVPGDVGAAATSHAHAESDVTGLVTDLAGKAPTTRSIATTAPLTGGGDLSADRTLSVGSASAGVAGVVPSSGLTAAMVAAANVDGAAGTASLRTLGTGAQQAAAGNDARLSDTRTPTAHASTHAAAGVDPVTVAESQVTGLTAALAAKEATANKGAASGYASLDGSTKVPIAQLPTGSSSTTVAIGNDARLSDSRTPTAHAASHNAGGGDALAIDAAAATGSLRTLGTSSTSAAAGNDARLSDARTPTAHATSHQDGGADELALDGSQITGGTVAAARLGVMTGDTGSGGTKGAVPAPGAGDATKFLRGDATFAAIPGGGDALVANPLSQFAATTSAQLAGVLSDEEGSGGGFVRATSPTLTTPNIGAATATSVNKVAITAPATGATLAIADGATLTVPATASVSGTNTGDQTDASGLTTGTLPAGRLPALTGDVTSSAGSASTTLANIPSGTPMAGSVLATAIAAPATPAAGKGSVYVDSTSKNLAVKDDAGTIKHGVQSKAAATSNFLTAISDAGVVSAAQPAASDITGLAAVATSGSASDLGTGTLPIARIADGAVTLAKLADLAQDQFIVRTTASTGPPQTATVTAAARTVLDDTTVGAMVDTLGGASASGTGGLARTTDAGLVRPAISGTPAAAGALGYDSATGHTEQYSGLTGSVGSFPRVLAVGTGTETLVNSTTSDQDFTSIYTVPANVIATKKVLRISLFFENISGTSSVTSSPYLKLGSTKVYASVGSNIADGVTRSHVMELLVFGRAAAGASANVSVAPVYDRATPNYTNNVNQPIAIATNGTLNIVPGITFSGTGSTESIELQGWLVEELN